MAVETIETPTPILAEDFTVENTSRASERFTDALPATYDDKDDMDLLRAQLNKRKRPIYAGVAFLCVVVIGVSIAVTSGGATEANTASGIAVPEVTTPAPTVDDSIGGVHGADISNSSSGSSSGSWLVGEDREMQLASNSSSDSGSDSSDGPILPYKDLGFNWKDPANWEYANFGAVSGSMVNDGGITLNPGNSPTPIRTKVSWGGEKILLIEWERSFSSDTNIWMLNERLRPQQFGSPLWPNAGELDIFEMFNRDEVVMNKKHKGFLQYTEATSFGELTMHTGTSDKSKCFCPPSGSDQRWYQDIAPMSGACAAQFSSADTKSMAVIWGSDGNGQFIQLLSNPTVTKGGKVNEQQTFDITPGGATTMKIYNNNQLHWGIPTSDPCVVGAGHNAATGYPFMENFFLVLEEQNVVGDAWFKVNNIQVFKK